MHQRSVPSAGGLYPLELYLIAEHVADLPPGLHRYDPQAAALEQLNTDVSLNSLIAELMGQVCVANAACLVFIAARLPRALDKYGARGYRCILFEAGHAAQNLCLLAWARGS